MKIFPDDELPQWQKDIADKRLTLINISDIFCLNLLVSVYWLSMLHLPGIHLASI